MVGRQQGDRPYSLVPCSYGVQMPLSQLHQPSPRELMGPRWSAEKAESGDWRCLGPLIHTCSEKYSWPVSVACHLGSRTALGFLCGSGAIGLCSVLQSCLTLCNTMDCSPPGSSVNGISQARRLEWVAMPFSTGTSWPRDQTHISFVSCTGSQLLCPWNFPGKNTGVGFHFLFQESSCGCLLFLSLAWLLCLRFQILC